MVHTRSFRVYLSAGMILGFAFLLGCAGQMKAVKAPEPPGTAHGQVVDMPALLAGADQAFKNEAYADARQMYLLARQNAEGLSAEQADLVKTRLARIESVLHERAMAAQAKEAAPAPTPAAVQKPAPEQKMAEAAPAPKPAAVQKPAPEQKMPEAAPVPKPAPAPKPAPSAAQKKAEQMAAAQKEQEAAAKKEADAQAAYDAGMKAYDNKDYLTAKKELQAAKDSGISFGGFLGSRNRRLRSRLTEVDETLNKLQTAYKSGKDSFAAGDFMTARRYLTSVTESGISLGKETDADIQKMMAGVDKKIADQRAAEQQKKLAEARAAAQLAAQRTKQMEEQAAKLAAEADALLKAQKSVQDNMAAADQAMAAGDMDAARKALTAAQETLKDPKVAAMKPLAGASDAIRTKLAQVDKAIAERKRMEDARASLAKMVQSAQDLSKTDLAAAERKAQDARDYATAQGVALTGEQSMVLAGVMQAAEQKFGLQRRLRREEYGKLAALARAFADGGQYRKAAELDAMVAQADPALVNATLRDQAERAADAAKTMADRQQQKAAELAAGFDKARQTLKSDGLEAALKARQDLIRQARDAKLSTDQAVTTLNKADLAFLDKDVRQAIEDASKALASSSDKMLAQARGNVKSAQQAQAAAVMPLDQKDQIARYYELAQTLLDTVQRGETDKAAAVKQQMADVKLKMEVQKAAQAMQQGKYDEAKDLLDKAPSADASEAVRTGAYAPVRAQLDAALAAQQDLAAAEDALADHDFSMAAEALQKARGAQKLPAPLQTKLEGLAAVLNAVRDARARLDGLSAANDQAVATVKQRLDANQQRQAAWDAYTGALKVLFTGSKDEAAKALADVAGKPGLTAAEEANVNEMMTGLGSAGNMAQGQAQQMLASAQSLYNAGDYAGAAQGLANVKSSPAYASDAGLQQRTQELEGAIQAKEQEADRLYAQAVAAYQAGDKEEVGRLMAELKAGYSRTKSFEQHR